MMLAPSGDYYDAEIGRIHGVYDDIKLDREIRHMFARKVYGIVATQLLCTLGAILGVSYIEPLRIGMQTYGFPISLMCMIVGLATLCYLYCVPGATSSYPKNYYLLGLFTACESGSLAYACSHGDPRFVIQAIFATSIIVSGLAIFAYQTKYDFTSWAMWLYIGVLGLMIFGIGTIIFNGPIFHCIFAAFGAIIFGLYLIIDLQMLIGKGKVRPGEDDYIGTSIMIYLDVVNIFLYIWEFIQAVSRD